MTKIAIWFNKALAPIRKALSSPMPWGYGRGWFPLIHEPFPGAWQRNMECRPEDALAFSIAQRCVSLISDDISKLPLRLIKEVEPSGSDIWLPHQNAAHSPVLRKPNHYQTRIQFYTTWTLSVLINGNAYVLKQRDARGLVIRMYVLDPTRVKVLVADDGSVFYELSVDNLSGIDGETPIRVPASEIIHHRINTFYHPLVGISPLRSAALAALHGQKLQTLSQQTIDNGAQPSGILTSAAGNLSPEVAKEIQDQWQAGFTGSNRGKVAVLGADLKYQQLQFSSEDLQMVEQLKVAAEFVCSAFGVPPYKVGIGPYPPYGNVQALNVQYYTDCLQKPIEEIELLLDEGLDLPAGLGVEFDTNALLRMDTATLVKAAQDFVASGAGSPNEARKQFFGLPPVSGGDTPYLLQQNFSLAALAKRDAQADPFATNTGRSESQAPIPDDMSDEMPEDMERQLAADLITRAKAMGMLDAA